MRILFAVLALILAVALPGCTIGQERWRAAADAPWDQEWADYSCQNATRFTQYTNTPGYPAPLFGPAAYRIELFDGDDSFGERCELVLGNTSASNYHGPASIFHSGDDLVIHYAYYLPTDYPFKPDCSNVSICEDGGLILQLKQLGSCGTPALGLVATGRGMFIRNSDQNFCESGPMHSILAYPLILGQWVQVAVRVKFSTDPAVGRIGLWYRTNPGDWVDVGNVFTHTMKSPTDHPSTACPESTPCSHARIGIYRDPDVSGHAVAFFDGYWVAEASGSW